MTISLITFFDLQEAKVSMVNANDVFVHRSKRGPRKASKRKVKVDLKFS